MRIDVAILFAAAVETLKIFFDEQMQARLRRRLDADLMTFGPLFHHIRRNCDADGLAVESCGNRVGVARPFQKINQLLPWRKLNQRLDAAAIAQLGGFLLRETETQ